MDKIKLFDWRNNPPSLTKQTEIWIQSVRIWIKIDKFRKIGNHQPSRYQIGDYKLGSYHSGNYSPGHYNWVRLQLIFKTGFFSWFLKLIVKTDFWIPLYIRGGVIDRGRR